MSAAQQMNYAVNAAEYLKALKKGIIEESNNHDYDDRRDNRDNSSSSSSSDDEVQTRSKTTKKTAKRAQRLAAKQQHAAAATKQEEEEESPIVERQQKNLTKRQQVLQRYADDEARGAASVLASIADAAITRSQTRGRDTHTWTENDRASASRAATIAFEVATAAAEATQGKKKKTQLTPYWTRFHEKNRSSVRFQKEMGRVMECDF
jgi:hypothetical protein